MDVSRRRSLSRELSSFPEGSSPEVSLQGLKGLEEAADENCLGLDGLVVEFSDANQREAQIPVFSMRLLDLNKLSDSWYW